MPDLSRKAVHEFWSGYQDNSVYRVICFLEGVETWTLDGNPDIEKALDELGSTLDSIGNFDLGVQQDIVSAGSHLTTGRILRLLQTLDAANPGAASRVLIHAEESSRRQDDIASLFLRRNIAFERLRLIGRVFSKERFALLAKALEGEDSAE